MSGDAFIVAVAFVVRYNPEFGGHDVLLESDYWLASGCHLLPPGLACCHLDAAVHLGVQGASALLADASGYHGADTEALMTAIRQIPEPQAVQKVLLAREKAYRASVLRNPTKAIHLPLWLDRVRRLRDYVVQQYPALGGL